MRERERERGGGGEEEKKKEERIKKRRLQSLTQSLMRQYRSESAQDQRAENSAI